ncbi:hypothetical protein [Rhizobium mongolense]|uniref:Uncharacterized protein n=2 Tax=Rhizobium mongolense TaxID=57676 RepID=A0ABR6IY90_9HYPH|nr:hypothetical protein [Rhizobium mongolense]MBB4232884.1 hypothetical protein [Rhizobium mongolense]TVZ74937.1 hypothetical protein BCL32_0275 [Rhizobium mongolense USDA 1844]
MADDSRTQLADLISRHRSLVALLGPTMREESLRQRTGTRGGRQLTTEEHRLRADIIAWSPKNTSEAREKLRYLASFIAATGLGFDAETLDVILKSVGQFF